MTLARTLILAAMLIWPTASSGSTPDPALVAEGGAPAGYALVWADEFDRDGLPDPARWDYDTERNRAGWWNGEQQYYARERAENARVENGLLIIEARKEQLPGPIYSDWGGQDYTSARLVTRGRGAWTYAFIEVRAKLPCGRGSWPAIWMLPEPPNDS